MDVREKLVEFLDEVLHYGISTNPSLNYVYNSDIADHLIANGATVQSTGQWISDEYGYNHCSECGHEWDVAEVVTPFCPICGANMEPDFGEIEFDAQRKLDDPIRCRKSAQGGTDNYVPTKWISVKDRLPDNKEHDWVLAQVVEGNGFMHIPKVMEYRQQRNDWYEETYGWLSEHNGAFTVTHWMPLPKAPREAEDES